MTLEKYIEYRTGEKSVSRIIRSMVLKPFMAPSLRSFWKYWNPGYGYFLLYFCYKPLRKVFPHWVSLWITFFTCGMLHDIFYIFPLMIMNNGNMPIPFVTTWFVLIGLGIIVTDYLGINFIKIRPRFRFLLHLGFLGLTFYATRSIDLLI